ncbi:MAG: glycosyltransferase [Hyphomicrobiaceae bacterium]|nr:glycosyltransferase [Hyphomicrobiaceae bacterium]
MRSGPLRIVVLGLSLSSSWGNGHATTYRALLRALAARGHDILFLERDVPWYASTRDLTDPDYCRLAFYSSLPDLDRYAGPIKTADAVVVGSYVPNGIAVGRLVQASARGVKVFYDIDTPVTLDDLEAGTCAYLSPELAAGYDLYLSFTGGPILAHIERRLGVAAARALYCSVDPDAYAPQRRPTRWDLSFLGTYSADRQAALHRLLIEPARRSPHLRFAVAGAQYPAGIAWPGNVERIEHVPPSEHPAFYAASRFTLNVTRAGMVRAGFSPSVRLFEAAAAGTAIISDPWPGLETILQPEREVIVAIRPEDVLAALLSIPESRRKRLGQAARRRVLANHTAVRRALQLEAYLLEALHGSAPRAAGRELVGTGAHRH